jgi:DNA polymerase-3 subunit delta
VPAPALKPAYLIHGDDHGAVAERRAGLRALAERLEGGANVELLEAERGVPAEVAAALCAMTLGMGQRVIIADGAERWREDDVVKLLAPVMAEMPPDTTLAVFAREDQRAKAPRALHDAIKGAGGQIREQATVKPWELPKWVREQAERVGLSLDAGAAKALVALVGERQQRLLRELEKLALEGDAATGGGAALRAVDADEIEQRAAHSSERRSYALADALVGGARGEALATYLQLREQGERLTGLTYVMASRLRDALAIAVRLQAGESRADVKRGLRMPARAADRLISDVAAADPEHLRAALATLADLELDTRGGAPIRAARGPLAGSDEETLAVRAIEAVAAGERAG